jgi:hypothetical protein
MIVVVYDTAIGAARSIGSQVPGSVPDGLTLYTLDVEYSLLGTYEWDAVTRTLVLRGPSQRTVLSAEEFIARLTHAEQVAIEVAKETTPALRIPSALLTRTADADVSSAAVVSAVNAWADALLSAGVLAARHRAAWVTAVLAPIVGGAP